MFNMKQGYIGSKNKYLPKIPKFVLLKTVKNYVKG